MTEAGPGGRVASADRVRRGGVAGFFAREHFEVVIEFDDEVAAASGAPDSVSADGPGAGARSWSDLIDVTEDVLEISGTSTVPMLVLVPVPVPVLVRRPRPPRRRRLRAPPALGSEARMPSTQKASFAAMLSAIARDTVTGDGVAANTVNTDNAADIADLAGPATSDTATNSTRSTQMTPAAAETPQPTGDHMAVAATPPWPVTAGGTLTGAWIDAIAAAAPQPEREQRRRRTCSRQTSSRTRPPTPRRRHRSPTPGPRSNPPCPPSACPPDCYPSHTVLSCLEALSTSDDAQTYVEVALTSALQQLPGRSRAPRSTGQPARSWSVTSTAPSSVPPPWPTAKGSTSRPSSWPRRPVIAAASAARLLVASPDEAADLAERSRRLPHPLVVAMHAPVSAEPDRWATRMLAALAPTAVWGVAPATHKSEDLAAWAEGLGGLDALALEDLSATTSPADGLAAGIPVASLDGRHATPALWAALIAARLLLARAAGRSSTGAIEGA